MSYYAIDVQKSVKKRIINGQEKKVINVGAIADALTQDAADLSLRILKHERMR